MTPSNELLGLHLDNYYELMSTPDWQITPKISLVYDLSVVLSTVEEVSTLPTSEFATNMSDAMHTLQLLQSELFEQDIKLVIWDSARMLQRVTTWYKKTNNHMVLKEINKKAYIAVQSLNQSRELIKEEGLFDILHEFEKLGKINENTPLTQYSNLVKAMLESKTTKKD